MIASARRLAMLQSTYDQCHLTFFRFSNLSSQQRGPHLHPYRSHSRLQKTRSCDQPLRRIRESVPRFAHVGLYTLPTCAADHSRQARNSVVASPCATTNVQQGLLLIDVLSLSRSYSGTSATSSGRGTIWVSAALKAPRERRRASLPCLMVTTTRCARFCTMTPFLRITLTINRWRNSIDWLQRCQVSRTRTQSRHRRIRARSTSMSSPH
jgi:hypothetical protein